MTRKISYLLTLVLVSAFAVFAQNPDRMRVTVPFSFTVASSHCTAGDYTVTIERDTGLVRLSSWTNSVAVLTTDLRHPKNDHLYLRFHRYGGRWFLNEVAMRGTVQRVIPSKMERELAKNEPAEEKILAANIER